MKNLTDKQINEQEVFLNRIKTRKLNHKFMLIKEQIINNFREKFHDGDGIIGLVANGYRTENIYTILEEFISQSINKTILETINHFENNLPEQREPSRNNTPSSVISGEVDYNSGFNYCLYTTKNTINDLKIKCK